MLCINYYINVKTLCISKFKINEFYLSFYRYKKFSGNFQLTDMHILDHSFPSVSNKCNIYRNVIFTLIKKERKEDVIEEELVR